MYVHYQNGQSTYGSTSKYKQAKNEFRQKTRSEDDVVFIIVFNAPPLFSAPKQCTRYTSYTLHTLLALLTFPPYTQSPPRSHLSYTYRSLYYAIILTTLHHVNFSQKKKSQNTLIRSLSWQGTFPPASCYLPRSEGGFGRASVGGSGQVKFLEGQICPIRNHGASHVL